jgi:hypothetical protein
VNVSGRSHYAEVEADLIEVLLAAVANAIQPADDVVYRGFVPPSPV